jgi:hypothetical protein
LNEFLSLKTELLLTTFLNQCRLLFLKLHPYTQWQDYIPIAPFFVGSDDTTIETTPKHGSTNNTLRQNLQSQTVCESKRRIFQ